MSKIKKDPAAWGRKRMEERKTVKCCPKYLGNISIQLKSKESHRAVCAQGRPAALQKSQPARRAFSGDVQSRWRQVPRGLPQVGSVADLRWKDLSLHSPRPSSIPYTCTQGPQATQGHQGSLPSLSWATRVLHPHLKATPGKLLNDTQLTQHHHFTWCPLCPTKPFLNSFTGVTPVVFQQLSTC